MTGRRAFRLVGLPGVACLVMLGAVPAAAEWHVWTLTRTQKVLRSAKAADEKAVHLAAARGEWESFQILMRSDVAVPGVRVEPGELTGPEGYRLRAADARLFRQHQLHITVPTYRNDAFQPDWYPDALIPFRHPISRRPLCGARLVAVPFDLPPGQTHGFWVDVYVPEDAPAGEYRGVYRVTAAEHRAVEIPLVFEVWDFQLPRVSSLRTAFGSPAARLRSYYAQRAAQGNEPLPSEWAEIDAQCAEMLSRHRINATPPPGSLAPVPKADGSFEVPLVQIEAFRRFVDRYHVNAFCVPHPRTVVSDPVAEEEKLHAWLAAWDRAAEKLARPQVLFYTYLYDEPNDEAAYRYVQKWGRAIRRANSVVKVLVVEQTWTQNEQWGDLYGAVDIWCPLFSLFKPESAKKRQARGEIVWTYTALCQGPKTPWWHTDFPLLHYRVPAWIAWRFQIRGLLYWGGMSFWKQVDDPWTEPGTLDRRDQRKDLLYNGEGSLVYPARAVGYEGIAPSLRLKALRDAIEDYEYLAILERSGHRAEAEEVVVPLARSWFEWNPDAAAYQAARARLARMILENRRR